MSDLDGLAELMCERSAALVLYARNWLDEAAARDAVQDVLRALLMQRQAPDDPLAWMYTAVRNASIDRVRSESRRRRREKQFAESHREWFEPSIDSLINARIAQDALMRLPIELREIVLLRIWSGLTLAQIAKVTRLSVSSVHETYALALEKLRNELESTCEKNMR